MAIVEPLKTHSGLELVPRCKPSTYQPIADDIATLPSEPVNPILVNWYFYMKIIYYKYQIIA